VSDGSVSSGSARPSRRLYSALLDPHGKYPAQVERLVWSLTSLAQVRAADIVVHSVDQVPERIRRDFALRGIELVRVSAFPGHRYANKVQQLESLRTLTAGGRYDEVVLLDCDLIVTGEPPCADGGIVAKMVDQPNPTTDSLLRIFAAAGLPALPGRTVPGGLPTVRANANGGVYVLDTRWLGALAAAWPRWATWCLQHRELFEGKDTHVDQVAFALAVASEHLPFAELDLRFNCPLGRARMSALDVEPVIIHYHREVDESGRLLTEGCAPRAARVLEWVNAELERSGMLDHWGQSA